MTLCNAAGTEASNVAQQTGPSFGLTGPYRISLPQTVRFCSSVASGCDARLVGFVFVCPSSLPPSTYSSKTARQFSAWHSSQPRRKLGICMMYHVH